MRPVGSTARLPDMLLSDPTTVIVDAGPACVMLPIHCTACMHVVVFASLLA